MVEADGDIAALFRQHAMDRLLLGETLRRAGQARLGNHGLVLLHPWHMRVAEHRGAVGPQFERPPRRAGHAFDRLQWQAIDEVEVQRMDAERAGGLGADLRLLVGLTAADGLLDGGFEILHAEADARHAHVAERGEAVRRKPGGVELDGDFGVRRECEPLAQPAHDRDEFVGRQHGRRAAAPMDVTDRRAPGNGGRDAVDLLDKPPRIGAMGGLQAHHAGVAAAIEAKTVAKRHMQIERKRSLFREIGEPAGVDAGADRACEMRRGGVARVTGRAPVVARQEICGCDAH